MLRSRYRTPDFSEKGWVWMCLRVAATGALLDSAGEVPLANRHQVALQVDNPLRPTDCQQLGQFVAHVGLARRSSRRLRPAGVVAHVDGERPRR